MTTLNTFQIGATKRATVVLLALLWLAAWTILCPRATAQAAPPQGSFTMAQTLSDGAQRTTLAFSGLAMMTGNLDSQSFFPPGKVADYTGFQYLRDNDPDNMGHNTSFLTRVANNVIFILNDGQFAQLKTLATAQLDQINLYGYKRFPLMKAFRRLLEGDIPVGSTGLDLSAVRQASKDLYLLDGQISFDRALLYANILGSMDSTQKAYLDNMKGKGWNSWPDIANDQIKSKMQGLPQGTAVAVMTYASDLFSWYAGSVDADVYFCPERQGTYYGSFYIKDAPAIGHEGYSIDEQLTATAGAALCDSSKGYVTPQQAALMSSLVATQRNNLYAGATNIVQVRTQIATLLRSLLVSTSSSESLKAQVLSLSGVYGELDGENNYNYATVFAQVYSSLTAAQKTKIAALRKSIMSGTYSDGTPFDFSVCSTPFLYSGVINDVSVLAPYIDDTDYLFLVTAAPLAAFSPSPESPNAGQLVTFTDKSTNTPTSWSWDFGDGASSIQQNPTHTFSGPGLYTVTLTAGNADGSNTVAHMLSVGSQILNPGTVAFLSSTYTAAENSGSVRIYVRRSGGADGAASINYATADGAAVAGLDYSACSGTLHWQDGDMADKFFDVTILDDQLEEGSESLTVALSASSGSGLGSATLATLTIEGPNDVVAPTDVNSDGNTDAVDIQLVINNALGLVSNGSCDINNDGCADAVDVQLVINGAMGLK